MNPGASTYQHQQHLGGAPVVVDPKFPPSEEYSQNNYIPSTGGDFFGGHHLNPHPQHHLQYGYHNHHQATTTPYGTANSLANGGYGYGNYYHHQITTGHPSLHGHQLRPALSMHTEPQQLPCASLQGHQPPPQPLPAVSNAGTILQTLADITPTAPTQPPGDVSSGVCSPASVGHGQGQDSRGSPPGHGLQDLGLRLEDNTSDDHDDDDEQMESPLMEEEEDDDSESGDRVIYPWMKKIHVAGVGK